MAPLIALIDAHGVLHFVLIRIGRLFHSIINVNSNKIKISVSRALVDGVTDIDAYKAHKPRECIGQASTTRQQSKDIISFSSTSR
jgi:hypothetical protein